jgi:hypothetical protein
LHELEQDKKSPKHYGLLPYNPLLRNVVPDDVQKRLTQFLDVEILKHPHSRCVVTVCPGDVLGHRKFRLDVAEVLETALTSNW